MVNQNGYKLTEIGVLPEEWDCVRIADVIVDISMGPFGSDIIVSNFTTVGVPVLNGNNVRSERLDDFIANYVTLAKAKSLKKAVAHRGDIVVTHRGTIGQISFIPMDSKYNMYVISQSQFRVTFSNKVDPHFITSYFHTGIGQSHLLEGKGHTGVPAIAQPTTTFRRLYLPLPSKGEQEEIVSALSDVDSLIDALQILITKKKTIKLGVMQELLTGKKRLPGFDDTWEIAALSRYLSVGHGQSQHTIEKQNGKYPILATGGEIGRTDAFLWAEPSVLIGRKGTINKPQYMETPFWTIDTLFYTQVRENALAKYLFYLFALIDWLQYNEASGVPSLSSNVIERIIVAMPKKDEQTAIALILSDMDAEIEQLEKKLTKYQQVKQGMMQELLTGKIRLINADAQVETVESHQEIVEANVVALPKKHNQQFDDAVMIAGIVDAFYSPDFRLGRKKVQKLLYLVRRKEHADTTAFKKKAAGPYADTVRYKGGEPIAKHNKYVAVEQSDKGSCFVKGENISQALEYILKWEKQADIDWLLSEFKYKNVNQLELLATIDMAMCDLREIGKSISVQTIKELIASTKEWRKKLEKLYFSDSDIQSAIVQCRKLFGDE